MARRERQGRGRTLATWIAGALTLLGSAALLRRHAPATESHSGATGRGRPVTPPSRRALAAGFETHDLSGGTLGLLVAGLGMTAATVVGIMFLMLGFFHSENRASAPPLTPEQTAQVLPPEPRLQADPVSDLARQFTREEALIHGYDWLDASHTRARIPIDRAMTLVVGHSLDGAP